MQIEDTDYSSRLKCGECFKRADVRVHFDNQSRVFGLCVECAVEFMEELLQSWQVNALWKGKIHGAF